MNSKAVNNDICQWLLESEGFQVDFLAENDTLWHLTPKLLEDTINHHTTMESLHQLLGDGIPICTPREKLILCYILANSMLSLYPGSWFQNDWSSTKIYFIRRANGSTSSLLTFPYLSVELQQTQKNQKASHNHMQYHPHPAILALGIIFLEIATSAKFVRRSLEPTQWKRYNNDGQQALQELGDWERNSVRDPAKRVSYALRNVIRSCLMLKPPANFPSKSLIEEGPIRHYILSCIVQPLASELRDGHKVCLETLHEALMPEKEAVNASERGQQRRGDTGRRTSPTSTDFALDKTDGGTSFPVRCGLYTDRLAGRYDLCLLADAVDKEVQIDENKWVMPKGPCTL